MNRPITFEGVKGHEELNTYFQSRLESGTLPQLLLLHGEPGCGKTTYANLLAKTLCCTGEHKPCGVCESCKTIDKYLIKDNKSVEQVKKFNMSIDGGKPAALEVRAELKSSLGAKVCICDECHRMSEEAQDVFLEDTEYMPEGKYLILATTDTRMLREALLSRAVAIPINRIRQSALVDLLREEALERNLTIQGGDATLNLIAQWADCKPRAALKKIEMFGKDTTVTTGMIKYFLSYVELDEVLPLVSSLSGSVAFGLDYISSMTKDHSIVDNLVEIVKIKHGQTSFKLTLEDSRKVREAVADIPEENIMCFLYELASHEQITTASLTASFIKAHTCRNKLEERDSEVFKQEVAKVAENTPLGIELQRKREVPSFEEMLSRASVIKEE